MRFSALVLSVLLLAPAVAAAEPGDRLTTVAIASYVGAQTADTFTSVKAFNSGQLVESNPILAGAENNKAAFVASKIAITAVSAYALHKASRHHPKLARVVAFAGAAVIGGIAIHNARHIRSCN